MSKKARRPLNRINLAARLIRQGLSIGDAARRANVSEEQVRRALGVAKKQLSEGEHMTEHGRKLGTTGLSYGTQAAEEMVAERIKKLEGRGYPDARSAAIGQLAAEGNLKTEGEPITRRVSLAEARRERSTEDRQTQGWLACAKEEAKQRGITLGEVMNERAMSGEVRL